MHPKAIIPLLVAFILSAHASAATYVLKERSTSDASYGIPGLTYTASSTGAFGFSASVACHYTVTGSTEPCPWSGLFSSIVSNTWFATSSGSVNLTIGDHFMRMCNVTDTTGHETFCKYNTPTPTGTGEEEVGIPDIEDETHNCDSEHTRNLNMRVDNYWYNLINGQ